MIDPAAPAPSGKPGPLQRALAASRSIQIVTCGGKSDHSEAPCAAMSGEPAS
jgi:hypothetical protein